MAASRHLLSAAVMTILAAACTSDADDAGRAKTTTEAITQFETTLREGPCPIEAPSPERVTCGMVTVPERHADPTGPTIELAVAIIDPVATDRAPDPLVLLAGGPGSGFVSELPELLESPIVEDRATVLVDHRGTGFSQPSLNCRELDAIETTLFGLDADDPQARQVQHDAVAECRARLTGDGIDLAAYNYAEIAADLSVLRRALGFEEWNLYGVSNGGRIALEVLRRQPTGVRSVVLDAALPPQGNLFGELWPHAQRAFDALFDSCRSDPACDAGFPELEKTFLDLVDRLATDPVSVDVDDPLTGNPVTTRFDEETGLNALRVAMYDSSLLPVLPLFLSRLAGDDGYAEVAGLIVGGRSQPGEFSHGMALSVNCQEEVASLSADFFDEQAAELPELASVITEPTILDDCEVWDVGRADATIDEAVKSDVPALVLVGQFDPVHPRSSSEAIVASLPNATLHELPGLGHGTVRAHECPRLMARDFLVDPTNPPDDRCIATMPAPAWALP